MATQISKPGLTTFRTSESAASETAVNEKNSVLQRKPESMSGFRRGDALVCTSGILWVTQKGDFADHILSVGEKFVAEYDGAVVLQSLTDKATWKFSYN